MIQLTFSMSAQLVILDFLGSPIWSKPSFFSKLLIDLSLFQILSSEGGTLPGCLNIRNDGVNGRLPKIELTACQEPSNENEESEMWTNKQIKKITWGNG
jgi:hypothetical protein